MLEDKIQKLTESVQSLEKVISAFMAGHLKATISEKAKDPSKGIPIIDTTLIKNPILENKVVENKIVPSEPKAETLTAPFEMPSFMKEESPEVLDTPPHVPLNDLGDVLAYTQSVYGELGPVDGSGIQKILKDDFGCTHMSELPKEKFIQYYFKIEKLKKDKNK